MMKKALILFLLLLAWPCASHAAVVTCRDRLPQPLLAAVDKAYPGWDITLSATIYKDQHAALVILRNGTKNIAVIVEEADGGAQITAANDLLIPDSETFDSRDWWTLDKWDTGAPFLWYTDPDNRYSQFYYVFQQDEQGRWFTSSGYFQDMEEILSFSIANGGTAFGVHGDTPFPQVFVPLTVDLYFDQFDPGAVRSACRETMLLVDQPTLIPSSMQADALPQGTVCPLIDDRAYPVYSDPGEAYARLGEAGDAAVSNESWVQVFGRDGGWLLIQYKLPEAGQRFGYITADAVAGADQIQALSFARRDATVTGILTDDPLRTGRDVTRLDHASCVVLATLCADNRGGNNGHYYIESGGFRGFVPMLAVTLTGE